MVAPVAGVWQELIALSVLALSSRFDGRLSSQLMRFSFLCFQYSLCRVVLMVASREEMMRAGRVPFSTRSVESF